MIILFLLLVVPSVTSSSPSWSPPSSAELLSLSSAALASFKLDFTSEFLGAIAAMGASLLPGLASGEPFRAAQIVGFAPRLKKDVNLACPFDEWLLPFFFAVGNCLQEILD